MTMITLKTLANVVSPLVVVGTNESIKYNRQARQVRHFTVLALKDNNLGSPEIAAFSALTHQARIHDV